jgi:translation initiation factor 3 subunit K
MRRGTSALAPESYRDQVMEPLKLVPLLEGQLSAQLQENFCDLDANVSLLKLYQLYPKESELDRKQEVLENILLKALMSPKDNAFTICMFLIPEKFHTKGSIPALSQLSDLLESAQYKEFWAQTKENAALLNKATGFHAAVRDFILDVVQATYRQVDIAFLCEALDQPDKELRQWLSSKTSTKADGEMVSFTPVAEVQRHNATPQNIQLEQLAKI